MRLRESLSFALVLTILFIMPARAQAAAVRYYVPASQFNAAMQVMDQGFANLFVMFQSATAGFQFDDGAQTIKQVKLAIDAQSLFTPNGRGVGELAQMLGVEDFPEISFMAASPANFKDNKAQIKGTLVMHGVSKPVTFDATLNQAGDTPGGGSFWGGAEHSIGLSLRASVKRADFGMGDPPEMPGRFGQEMTLLLEMRAVNQ